MSYKGSRHRTQDYQAYQNTLEEIRENSKNLTGIPCEKHEQFNKCCLKCWEVTEKKNVELSDRHE